MRGKTHLAAGLALASLLPNSTVEVTAALAIGALLPDIDDEDSLVGRYVPIIPKLFQHRQTMHRLIIPLLLWNLNRPMAIGVISHLMLDFPNPKGLPLLWPISKKSVKIPIISKFIPSGGFLDKLLGYLLGGFALYQYIAMIFGTSLVG